MLVHIGNVELVIYNLKSSAGARPIGSAPASAPEQSRLSRIPQASVIVGDSACKPHITMS